MEILEIVERVGAYAGFAAVVGLAVLSALYFSQARDLRRLREWAGRAPERTASPRPGVRQVPRPTTGAPQRPAAGVGAAQPGRPGVPATAPPERSGAPATAAAPAVSGAPATASAAPPTSSAPADADRGPVAVPAGQAPARPGNGPARPASPRTAAPPLRARTAAAPVAPTPERRGLAPRYIALIAAGLLVVGGGIAFGVVTFASAPEAPPATPAATRPGPIAPGQITVAVLNGTTVPGLAAQLGDRVESGGFRLGNVTNASEQQRAESVVLYAPGAAREARAVGRELRIAQTERAENGERTLAGSARVIVVAGADMTDE